jgi:protein-tyrosine phosphatase
MPPSTNDPILDPLLFDPRRHLPLRGTYNVRDVGGYPTADGRHTKWRTLFRGDGLELVPPGSQAILLDYGLRTVIDLRGSYDKEELPSAFEGSDIVKYHHINLIGDELLETWRDYEVELTGATGLEIIYETMLDGRQEQMQETLAALADGLPALVHCAVGKDRTGVVTALVLSLAGVADEIIVEDYALSAHYLHDPFGDSPFAPDDLDKDTYTWQDYQAEYCPTEAMRGTLLHLRERYGDATKYMRTIGLTVEQINTLQKSIVE